MSTRPIYMLIFHDLLQKHNDNQQKYAPPQNQQQRQTTKSAEKPSVSFSNASSNSVMTARPTNTAATVSSRSTSAPNSINNVSASSQQSYVRSATHTNSSGHTVLAPHFSGPGGTTTSVSDNNPLSGHRTSMEYNQMSTRTPPLPPPKVVVFPDSNAPSRNRLTTVRRGVGQRPVGPANTSGGNKDSSSPSVSHAPRGVMGTSSGLPADQRKKLAKTSHVSLAKTIADQTPNGFKTLGPGFNRNAPVEKSLHPMKGSGSGSLASTIMPSDYEHIYHAPSQLNLLDAPSTDQPNSDSPKKTYKKHHAKKST